MVFVLITRNGELFVVILVEVKGWGEVMFLMGFWFDV